MSCESLSHLKKYYSRNSPPFSASSCKDSEMIGNDYSVYLSKPNKNGVYRWVNMHKAPVFSNRVKRRPSSKKSKGKRRPLSERRRPSKSAKKYRKKSSKKSRKKRSKKSKGKKSSKKYRKKSSKK
jgi:hypothetical protein